MRYVQAVNRTRGRVLGTRVGVADRWWQRARGLLGAGALPSGAGLLLRPCRAVHTLGMGMPLDVAFLDRGGTVVAVYRGLRPWGGTRWHPRAEAALELPAGTLGGTGTLEGDVVVCGAEDSA